MISLSSSVSQYLSVKFLFSRLTQIGFLKGFLKLKVIRPDKFIFSLVYGSIIEIFCAELKRSEVSSKLTEYIF